MCAPRIAIAAIALLAMPCAAQVIDLPTAMEQVQELVRQHRYNDVVHLLLPFDDRAEGPEARYAIDAELGRAYFHLGRYHEAHQRLRAAVSLQPRRVETALYLEATSYLLGDREQALTIFREIVRSGAHDLYIAVTLPGERSFLSDPEVWRIVAEHAVPLEVDPWQGRALGLTLGMERQQVLEVLDVTSAERRVLTASAGPHVIWALTFSDDDRLDEVVLHSEYLLRYTPYRLQLGGLDWRSTPADAMTAMGTPSETASDERGNLVMTWLFEEHSVSVVFGRLSGPRPPEVAENVGVLRIVTMARLATADSASMDQ